MVYFDERNIQLGTSGYQVTVNGNIRYTHYWNANNLYSTYLNIGDVVTIDFFSIPEDFRDLSVVRVDYTTDDENGDKGIKNTIISNQVNFTGSTYQFTATTLSYSYDFEYRISTSYQICLSIGNGFTRSSGTNAVREVKIINDKIFCMGNFNQYNLYTVGSLAVLNFDGSLFSGCPLNILGDSGTGAAIEEQSDGKIILSGGFTTYSGVSKNRIVRINSDFTIDNTFNIGTGFNDTVFDIEIQSDGKILCGGIFTSYNGTTVRSICRLNTDGTLDNTFTSPSSISFGNAIYDISLYSDGKILISGNFSRYNGIINYDKILRLNVDGSVDTTFTSPYTGISSNGIYTNTILDNNKILIGGDFLPYLGSSTSSISKLNSDGSVDNTFVFTGSTGLSCIITKITSDEKYLALFVGTNGGLYKLNQDGSIDNSFNILSTNTGFLATQESIAIKSNGNIIVGGGFTTVDSLSYNRLFMCDENGNLMMCNFLPIPSPTPTPTITPTKSLTPTPTPSITPTNSLTPTPTITPSITPSTSETYQILNEASDPIMTENNDFINKQF